MSLRRIHPHGPAHVFDQADQLPPASGTLRLYVDGTLGDDNAAGTSWATAWKTLAKIEREVAAILMPNPTALRIDVFVKGAFSGGGAATEDLRLAGALHGGTQVNVIHHMDDWTEIAAGTINTIAATTLGVGLKEVTFNGIVLDATYQGRWVVFENGAGKRLVFQILRVSGATAWISATAATPAWVVGGGTITASVREPSVSGIRYIRWGYYCAEGYLLGYDDRNVLMGLTCAGIEVVQASNAQICVKCSGVLSLRGGWDVLTCIQPLWWITGQTRAQEYGIVGTANLAENSKFSSWCTSTTLECTAYGGVLNAMMGYFGAKVGVYYSVSVSVAYVSAEQAYFLGGESVLTNTFIRGKSGSYGLQANHGSAVQPQSVSFVDLPAAGLTGGLISITKGAWLQLSSQPDGNNTGTAGSGLYAITMEKGSTLQCESGPSNSLTGKHGRIRIVDGEASFAADLSWAACEGGGPDIYAENARLHFAGHFVKTAVNTLASPVLTVARNTKVTQATGKNFTLPAGSGNYTTDYGADGPIVAKDGLADIRLGNLTGGTGATTGPGATLRNGARLVHAGVGLSGSGVSGPLKLGGLAAGPWPVAGVGPYDDAGAVVPESCVCIPGVT